MANGERPLGRQGFPASETGQQAALPKSDLKIRDLISVLRRGKSLLVLGALLGLAAGVLLSLVQHKQYAATSLLELTRSSSGDPLGLTDLSGLGSELSQGDQVNADLLTQLTVISSDSTALDVLEGRTPSLQNLANQKPFAIPADVKSDSPLGRERGLPLERAPRHRTLALKQFHAHLSVEVVKGTRLLSVTYTDPDPDRAAAIANAVVDASIALYADERLQASARGSEFLEKQLVALKSKAEESQRRMDDFQRTSGLAGLTTQGGARNSDGTVSATFNNLPMERLLELNRDLASAKLVTTQKEAIYNMAQRQDPALVLGIGQTSLASGSVVAAGSPDLDLLQKLRQRLAAAELELSSASAKYGAKNPTEIRLQTEVASLRGQVADEMQQIKSRTLNDLQVARKIEQGLQQQVAAQQAEVAKSGGAAAQLLLLQQGAEADRALYQSLNSKREEANAVAGLRSPNISVVDVARPNPDPVKPQPVKLIGTGFAGGLLLGTAAAFLMSFASDTIQDSGDVAGVLPAPLLGTVPDFRTSRSRRLASWLPWGPGSTSGMPDLVLKTAPGSEAAEAYRLLRTTMLQRVSSGQPVRSVLFMSGGDGEGRTTTCLNVSAAFAAQGLRVLMVDADLRSGPTDRAVPAGERGLTTCLTADVDPLALVQLYPGMPDLAVLPAGPAVSNPSELLGGDRFRSLLQGLQEHYDFLFFDSPPALAYADARVLASAVDATVLVLRAQRTTAGSLEKMAEWMRTSGRAALGLCLNAVDPA